MIDLLISYRAVNHVLIFNQQGHREAIPLLKGLYSAITAQGRVKFNHVVFCTNAGQQIGNNPPILTRFHPSYIRAEANQSPVHRF